MVAANVDVQVEFGLDPSVDGALCLGDDRLLRPIDGLVSLQLTKSIMIEVTIVFALRARVKVPRI